MTQATELPGRATSPWLDTERPEARPRLARQERADVAVLGGGIVGVTTALMLARGGADVILLEGGRIGQGVSGRTTAKLSSLHGLTYASLARTHGAETARVYGEANQSGIETVAGLVAELGIECAFRRKPNFTYAEDQADLERVEEEVEAALAAGLPASFSDRTDLPFPVAGAIRFADQAEFDPIPYLDSLVAAIVSAGGRVFERTRAVGLSGARVLTADGVAVEADRVVVATHLPILDRGGQFAYAEPERSYAIGAWLDGDVPQGMYLSTESPAHSLRAHAHPRGELFLVGGESHKMGSGDAAAAFLSLERWARDRFSVADVAYRWSAHDYMPVDGLPLVGRLSLGGDRVLTATGLRKWGLAMGTAAATMLADAALGRESPWADTFDPVRLPPLSSLAELAKHNGSAGLHFFGDRLRRAGSRSDLSPGEGGIADAGLGKTALYRDERGELHALSARCTHLGCLVHWNGAERTWDCPCHGSRFEATGAVLEGPATQPLRAKDPPG